MAITFKFVKPKQEEVGELMNTQMKLRMRSFSNKDVWYDVDRAARTCSCQQFKAAGTCKHLEEVGAYAPKDWTPKTYPTFSQALSGLVKSIRIRNVAEAMYWLVYLDTFTAKDKSSRFRVARRLLIGSAEDGVSVAVMEKTSANYPHLCHQDTHLIHLAAEVVRICKVPNWWHPDSGGPDYIHAALVAARRNNCNAEKSPLLLNEVLSGIESAVDAGDRYGAAVMLDLAANVEGYSRGGLCDFLLALAQKRGNQLAQRVFQIHATHKPSLKGDWNFLGQGLWHLAGGIIPVADQIELVYSKEIRALLDEAYAQWKEPHPIPGWCCDGIHCAGADRRFAGMTTDMDAVSQAFLHYGVMDPSKEWKPEFYTLDGLEYQ